MWSIVQCGSHNEVPLPPHFPGLLLLTSPWWWSRADPRHLHTLFCTFAPIVSMHWLMLLGGVYLLLMAVSACVPAHSSMDSGNCSLPSPSPSRRMSKLRHGAPALGQQAERVVINNDHRVANISITQHLLARVLGCTVWFFPECLFANLFNTNFDILYKITLASQ